MVVVFRKGHFNHAFGQKFTQNRFFQAFSFFVAEMRHQFRHRALTIAQYGQKFYLLSVCYPFVILYCLICCPFCYPLYPALGSLGLFVVVYAYEKVSPANFPSYHEIKLHIIFLLEIKAQIRF